WTPVFARISQVAKPGHARIDPRSTQCGVVLLLIVYSKLGTAARANIERPRRIWQFGVATDRAARMLHFR
ncbi:MAG TPA: hypothetical protein VFM05_05460, partial [Candidatus Saccharimonadales bacterium]|nr:hypothetical protein [Candidatus Saccharimonadales bacterium]